MRSTAAVLWLMILLVFVPIAGLHGLARYLDDGPPPPPPAAQAVGPGPVRGG